MARLGSTLGKKAVSFDAPRLQGLLWRHPELRPLMVYRTSMSAYIANTLFTISE